MKSCDAFAACSYAFLTFCNPCKLKQKLLIPMFINIGTAFAVLWACKSLIEPWVVEELDRGARGVDKAPKEECDLRQVRGECQS